MLGSIRNPRTLAFLAVAGALAVPATVPSAAGAATCQVSGSKPEEASRSARVFSRRESRRAEGRRTRAPVRAWYGCLHSRGRRVGLGVVGAAGVFLDRIAPVRLAGRYVGHANEFTASPGDATGAVVLVTDLRTGRVKRRFENAPTFSTYDVTDLELSVTGSVAWIARVRSGAGGAEIHEVVKMDSTTATAQVLDAGPSIAPDSLALSGSTLYWTNGAVPRSAVLR